MAVQNNWRLCINCKIIFFGGNSTKGKCPAGDAHLMLSNVKFQLKFFGQKSSLFQDNWRWCRKCEVLFFHGNQFDGVCPAGGPHDSSNSGNYQILLATGLVGVTGNKFAKLGQFIWCAKCEGMWLHFPQGLLEDLTSAGVCPAVGFHTFQGSGRYNIPSA